MYMVKWMKELILKFYIDAGWSIKEIADYLNLKERTVIAVVAKRPHTNVCLCCGKQLEQIEGHRQKEFCSPKRYRKWRRENVLTSTAKHICQWCGKEFLDPYHLDAKYCSKECRNKSYIKK